MIIIDNYVLAVSWKRLKEKLILRLGYAYCVFFIYSYFLLCDFGKTRTTFFENTYVFQHKHHDIFTILIINTLNKVFDYWLIVVFSVKKSFSRWYHNYYSNIWLHHIMYLVYPNQIYCVGDVSIYYLAKSVLLRLPTNKWPIAIHFR